MSIVENTAESAGPRSRLKRVPSSIWRGWLKFAEKFGTVQMIIILSLVYWVIITLMAIPYKLIADPLKLRRRSRPAWIERDYAPDVESMERQY